MYLAYRAWQRLIGQRAAALADAGFVSLWVTEYYGDQVMPNLYVALGAVAAAAFLVRALAGDGWRPLLAASACLAWVALVRPTDAAWLDAGFVLAGFVVAGRRHWRQGLGVTAAVVAGVVVGSAEWAVEAVVRFGSIGARLHEAGSQNATGVTFSLPMFARAVNGPLLCRPCNGHRIVAVGAAWWLVLLILVLTGLGAPRVVRRNARALVPTLGAVTLAGGYVFSVPYAAPRFLLPAYALLAVPGALGAISVVSWSSERWGRGLTRGVVATLVTAFALEQAAVLAVQVRTRARLDRYDATTVADLRSAGVHGHCTVAGPVTYQIPFFAGCSDDYDALVNPARSERPGANEGDDVADRATQLAAAGVRVPAYALVLPDSGGARVPRWARNWRRINVDRRYTIYLPPR
jgi:hypothetical protein